MMQQHTVQISVANTIKKHAGAILSSDKERINRCKILLTNWCFIYIYIYIYTHTHTHTNTHTYTWTDNKVRELATVCLQWQQWTKALIWFDGVDKSAFHSYVVVDLWQSLSEWHLLLPACVLVCRRENVGA